MTGVNMDRRQKRTRKAIFIAFNDLLSNKAYDKITVQEIISAADIGRTTFYAHFDTKEALLEALCEDLFLHIKIVLIIYLMLMGCINKVFIQSQYLVIYYNIYSKMKIKSSNY